MKHSTQHRLWLGGNTSISTEFLHAILVQVIRDVIKSSVPTPSYPYPQINCSRPPWADTALFWGLVSRQKFISKRLRELGRALIIVTSEIKNKDALWLAINWRSTFILKKSNGGENLVRRARLRVTIWKKILQDFSLHETSGIPFQLPAP